MPAKGSTMSTLQFLFGFNGRIRRSHYWVGSLAVVMFGVAAIFAVMPATEEVSPEALASINGPAFLFVYAILTWCSLALQIKRWHDRNKSGLWVLIGLVPLIGGIWQFIECGVLDGTQGPNRFGESPKGAGASNYDRVFG